MTQRSEAERRAMFARMNAGRAGQRGFTFPVRGRGGTARRNREILYGAGVSLAVAGAIAGRKFVPKSMLRPGGFIAAADKPGEVLRAGRGDVVRLRQALRRQAAELRGTHRGLRTQSAHYPLNRPVADYQHPAGKNATMHQAFVYDRPARGGPLWPGQHEQELFENPLLGGLARRLIGGEEGKVVGVPPLTRYMMDPKKKYSLARLRLALADRLGNVKLRGERFEGALDDLEEGAVRRVRRQVRRGVRRLTEPQPPKTVLRQMKRKIRRDDPTVVREIRRAILTERGIHYPEGGLGLGAPFRHGQSRGELRDAFKESRRAADRYLTREAVNRLSKDYPAFTERLANRVVSPLERLVDKTNQFANERAIQLGRRLGFPVDDVIAEQLKKAGGTP